MAQTYRYKGDTVIVVIMPGGGGLPIEPGRPYDADDLVVVSRPELFEEVDDRVEEVDDRDTVGAVESADATPGTKRTRVRDRG